MGDGGLMELVRTGAFALWALVVYLAVKELKLIRRGIMGKHGPEEEDINGRSVGDRLLRLERHIEKLSNKLDPGG